MSTKDELRIEMLETQRAFHALLAEISDEAFARPSDNPAWTIGEVLFHMSLAPRFLIADLRVIFGHPLLAKLFPILVPISLFNRLNEFLTRRGARNLNRTYLADQYDQAHERAMQALQPLTDTDLQKALEYPGYDPMLAGTVTVERLFHYVKLHFEAHERQIRGKLG